MAVMVMAAVAWGGAGAGTEPEARKPEAAAAAAAGEAAVVEFAPGLRLNRAERWVEFDGAVAVDAHDPQTPDVYLEVIVTSPDTREHEALVVTAVKPSLIHAALLALGLEAGSPGRVSGTRERVEAVEPRGARVGVEFWVEDAPRTAHSEQRTGDSAQRTGGSGQGRGDRVEARAVSPVDWVVSRADGGRLRVGGGGGRDAGGGVCWVFAGSRVVTRRPVGEPEAPAREVYDADGAGVIIGLHCFGSEVLAWPEAMSPDAATLTPEWICDARRMPAVGTKVVVRVTAEAERAAKPAAMGPEDVKPKGREGQPKSGER